VSGALAIGLLAWRIGSGLPMPGAEQREDANLIATRPGGTVRRWIVAHVDSKAQGHSMAGRLVAAWLLVLAAGVHTILAFYRWLTNGGVNHNWIISAMLLTVIAGALASRGRLRGGSPGARDNGTGLLSALVAAEQSIDPSVGFLFSGAEEFGLVGARVFVRATGGLAGTEVINVDTLDSRGPLYVVTHDGHALPLAGRITHLLQGAGTEVRQRGLPMGILVDSLPFARAGAHAVTVARLDWGTLRLIHTAADTSAGLSLDTAERTGTQLAKLGLDTNRS
jgi:hypothetical protein